MTRAQESILQCLLDITQTANRSRISYQTKLQHVLDRIVDHMDTEKGSLMLMKGRKYLEVVASTNPELIGVKQSLDQDSPSSWVVKNKQPLYVDMDSESPDIRNKFFHYKKSAFLLVPVINNGVVIGVINLTDKLKTDCFSKSDQNILLLIAGHIIGTLENIRLTESLKKKRKVLQGKNRKLKQLEKVRTELFNMLIHDLKGPLSEIVANIDILSYTVKKDNMEFVEASQTACNTLYRMISNLLDVTRLEEGSLKLLYERVSPDELIREALSRMHGISKVRDINLNERFPVFSTPPHFFADRNILLRVLQNLLINAVHYSPAGETIETGYEYTDNGEIIFFVKDNGPGIPLPLQQAIFDKFMQVDKKNDGRQYTTGLGLTFCKLAVEAHRGGIFVESDGLRGSCFKFNLPLE